jgi:hypothetical protein
VGDANVAGITIAVGAAMVDWLVGAGLSWQAASINPTITNNPILLIKVIFSSL